MIPLQLPTFAFSIRRLGSLAFSFCLAVPCATAQNTSETNSHVLLEMPTVSGADNVLMQYQMLMQLQQMANSSPDDSPLDVEQLLKGMSAKDRKAVIDYAQQSLLANPPSDGMNIELPSGMAIPPELQQLADRFGQTQDTPRGSGPELRRRTTPRTTPSSEPRSDRPSSTNERPEPARTAAPSGSYGGRTGELQPAAPRRSAGTLPSSTQPNTGGSAGQQPANSLPRNRQPNTNPRDGDGSTRPSGGRSTQIIQMLRSLAEENPQSAERIFRSIANRSSSQDPSNASKPGITSRPDSTQGLDVGSLQDLLGGNGDTSMQDLLRQMSSDPSQLPPIEDLAGLAGAAKDAAGGYAKPLSQQLKSMVDGDLARKVERTGLGKTLSGLLKEARKAPAPKTDPNATSGTSKDSGNQSLSSSLEKSVLTTLDGFGKSLLGNKDKKKGQTPTTSGKAASNKDSESSSDQPTTAGKTNDSAKSTEKSKPGFIKSASKAFDGWVSRNSQSQSPAPQKDPGPKSSANANIPGVGSLPGATGIGGLLWLVLGLAALAAVLWFAFRSRLTTLLGDNSLPFPSEALRRIRTHADVIAAFHAIAYRASGDTQPWWTHRRTVDELARHDSTVRSAWERLASLYEESRYQQGKQALSPEQAQRAEQAIRTLAQAPANA